MKQNEIIDFKHYVVNLLLKAGVIILSVADITLIMRDYPNIFTFQTLVQNFFLIILAIFVIYRNRIPLTLKIALIIFPLYFILILGLMNRGLIASAKVYIIIVPVITSFILTYKKSVLIMVLYLITYLIIGFLITKGFIPNKIQIPGIEYTTWISEAVIIFLGGFVLLYIGHNYNEKLIQTFSELKTSNKELTEHKQNLEFKVKERTDDLVKTNEIIHTKNEELKKTINDLKDAQIKLIQAEKMASLGTLTAGVAHEINNPLNYLMGAQIGLDNYFLKYGSHDTKVTNILLNSIKVGIERISDIVTGLNQFSLNNEDMDEFCDIHAIIDNCLTMLREKIKNKVEVRKEYSRNPFLVIGNVGQIHQVFINILSNAIYAIKDKGSITIKSELLNANAFIEIIDDGSGIEQKYLSQVTDPFFTTKPPGEGTGLGLSITQTIITDHKGEMKIESEINKGTKVIIKLPVKLY